MTTSTSDVIWGDFRPGFFDPCPLATLAEYMRDGKWLDMQTESGKLQRVRVTEIRVRTQGEDVMLRQEWLTAEGVFRHRELAIDSDCIWRATPVTRNIGDVEGPRELAGDAEHVFGVIVNVLIADTGFTTGQLTSGGKQGRLDAKIVNARHSGLVMQYEMTDDDPLKVCERFGYMSPQALNTGLQKMDNRGGHDHLEAFKRDTKRRAREVWKQLGFPSRRQASMGYREPVL